MRPLRVLASPGLADRDQNPYTFALYSQAATSVEEFTASRAFLGRYDVVHFHWPEESLNYSRSRASALRRLLRQCAAIDYLKMRGTRLFWTVHNLHSHEGRYPAIERRFWDWFTARVDGFIALSNYGKEAAVRTFPHLRRVPGFVIPHGNYRGAYPESAPCARKQLGIRENAKVILHLGWIRPYKNVPALIRAFKAASVPDSLLVIAGRTSTDALRTEIGTTAQGDNRIRLELNHVPAPRVAQYFEAADLVVLPYTDILNSGTALLALSLNRPVLLPNAGAMPELASEVGENWVRCYNGDLTPEVLSQALEWSRSTIRPESAPVDHLAWSSISAKTIEAYETVLAAASRLKPQHQPIS